jgi:hypothetical protein
MGGAVVDPCLLYVVGDRVQDLQDLSAIGTATEQGEGKGRSHGRSVN